MESPTFTTADLNQFAPQLKSFAMKFTNEPNLADDLLQDTYVKALRSFTQYQQGTNLKAWLFTIMRNTFINDFRKNKREKLFVDVVEDITSAGTSQSATVNSADGKFAIGDINLAMAKLPTQLAYPFMRYFEGYKYHEIAEEFEMPIGTVKTRIHYARLHLKKYLRVYEELKGKIN